MKRSFQIGDENVGNRLDHFLYDQIGTVSRMFLTNSLERGAVSLNREPHSAGGYKLKGGDAVEIEFDETAETAMTPEDIELDILFEDAEFLVVNKAAGMLVHPTKHIKTGTLANALAFHLNFNSKSEFQKPKSIVRPVLVHRLDRETSGLMAVAKTERAARILSSHFERKLIEKRYLAVVSGKVAEESGKIIAPVGRFADEKPHWRVAEDGKAAETNFRVLERRADSVLLELEPVTGRTNQLRIHCAFAGFPIVGDTTRGGREFPRLCLHAAKLAFNHPNGTGWLEFETTLPREMEDLGS